ncbi:MAG: PorV/PorQ family protein [Candidatus Eisenbacteria bacterium]|uniref:PorV/PorQ family protein n=1 Tax=Eiseniibacteriota bacterium TaxID=2212470 RepID=A0A937X649_UNCEI|nr:PorV/PorQ family protein [Candidatus Eisenbacteria bacterium]
MPGRRASLATAGALLAALLAPGTAAAQTDLGGQRVGTSSGAFLKVALDARGSALGGAVCAHVDGPASLFWNPAGLGLEGERGVLFSGVDYTAGIPAGAAAVSFPFAPLRGAVGVGFAALAAVMDETDEFHPLGTGRRFSYRTWTLSIGASRALTDKLSFGAAGKLFHEGLGTEVGGPQLTTWLVDAGAIYFVGYRDARIGIALSNFGPDLRPAGDYTSRRHGASVRYTSFSPPTVFRFGCSIDPWRSAVWRTVALVEFGHPADNREILRLGGEAVLRESLSLRAGYDFSADALRLHAGFGARVRMGDQLLRLDYGFSDGGDFGAIHRWTLQAFW